MQSALDVPLAVTFFAGATANTKRDETLPLRELAELIRATHAPDKAALPWVKLARFGDQATAKRSLRHDANVLAVHGIELDYDAETLQPTTAIVTLRERRVFALLYSSPSHADDRPRFRLLLPLARSLPPAARAAMVSRAAGLFPDAEFAAESWTLSQSYFFGHIEGRPVPVVLFSEGDNFRCIDQCDEFDAFAKAKPGSSSNGKPAERPSGFGFDAGDDVPHLDVEAALATLRDGAPGMHQALISLAGHHASQGLGAQVVMALLQQAMLTCPAERRTARWHARLAEIPRIAGWTTEKEAARPGTADTWGTSAAPDFGSAAPDPRVLALRRRPPPRFPLDVFGARWRDWMLEIAHGSAAPVDYVAGGLLAVSSALIGNSRWAAAHHRWAEPPHLWLAGVGHSGDGKSPAVDVLFRDIVPPLEQRMARGFAEQLRDYAATVELDKARAAEWKTELRQATREGRPPPAPPIAVAPVDAPERPVLRMADCTIEKVALVLAKAAPKGVLMARDELAGWLTGMGNYNTADRQFWLEAYGGRPYRVDRVKHPEPILVSHLAVSWHGGIQPERLAELLADADDGLLARLLWLWPEPVPFELVNCEVDILWALEALDRLRALEMGVGVQPADPQRPVTVPLTAGARTRLITAAKDVQQRKQRWGGLMLSAAGKARGAVLRLALNLEFLWWAAREGWAEPPIEISEAALAAATTLMLEYFLPTAEAVYGEASTPAADRGASVLARWIIGQRNAQPRPVMVNARAIRREGRLPGLNTSETVKAAIGELIEACWLAPAPPGAFPRARLSDHAINPAVWALTP
jgi:hypothetical protein